ncbi:MAG: serine--tRNA ligase [Bacilli bacterium]|jgi:seryl-tRNA synthetase|nr:serine--tRNA ligase [Bacilli bacterium]
MIDINRIRENKKDVEKALLKRMDKINLDELLEWDKEKRKIGTLMDEYRAQRRKVSDTIPALKKEGKDTTDILNEMKELGDKIDEGMVKYNELDKKIFDFLAVLPNIPDEDVVEGGKENNEVIKTHGEKPEFDFELKPHYEILKDLKMIDFNRGTKIAGEKNWVYTGIGARLEWALVNFFIDTHLEDGYEFMLLPYLLNYDCGFGAGQFPKFTEEVYKIQTEDDNIKFLLPTAETALVNLHAGEIMDIDDLPKKYFGYTQCFRVEAGSSREEERGTIRGHQFNKVEMVQYTTDDKSEVAFEELVNKAMYLMDKLGLHYQVSKLAAGDCSQGMCRTYDIEVWIPSMGIYKEVSSVSNARDYQARRNNTKYRDKDGNIHYACTLNGSGLATSRLLPAIVEQYQNADGSVTVPLVLRKYLGGLEVIK